MFSKQRFLITLSFSLSLAVLLLGLLTIWGYNIGNQFLTGFSSTAVMNPVTAICFIFLACWQLLYHAKIGLSRHLAPFVAGVVTMASIFKLLQFAGVHSLDFDKRLFSDALNSSEGFKSIAPNSSLLLLLCGISVFNTYSKSKVLLIVNDLLKISGCLISYLAIIGYVYDFEMAYRIGSVPMAFNTALAYGAFFTVSIIAMPPGSIIYVLNSGNLGGRMARRAIPLVLVLPLLFGYLKLMGERALLFDPNYGAALESAFMVFFVLVFVFLYARRLNIQDEKRKYAETQIKESEKRYRTLVNSLRESVVYYDMEGIISFCNRSFIEMSGFTEEEIIGKSVFDFFIKDEQKERYRALLENRVEARNEIYEESVRTNHGNNIWVSISARPVVNEKGEKIGSLSTIVDITERKKQLEDIEAFSASAAHDINAPLARIEMIAMLLIESTENQLDKENMELLTAIAGITSNMRQLLKDLLLFSKLGASNIEKVTLNTNEMVKEIIDANKHLNPKATFDIKNLPAAEGDKTTVRQVFTNLIANALKYSSHKESPIIEIGSRQTAGHPTFYIKDNGAGFDMKDAHKLFAAFQRLHIEFEGNGLGLPIVRRIIEKHGGKIWAEGVPGEGATFYFTLG